MVSLTVQTTPPGAEVFIDSSDTLKITPVTLDITAGQHTYMLKLNGYVDITGDILVVVGTDYTLQATMSPTAVDKQLELYGKMVKLGWAGVAVAAVGILIGLYKSGRGKT